MERQVISAVVRDKTAFDKVGRLLARGGVLSDQYSLLFKEVVAYYETDPQASAVDPDWLIARLTRKYDKHADMFSRMVTELPDISTANVVEEFIELRKQRIGEQLASALLMHSKEASDLIEQYREADILDEETEQEEVYEGVHVRELAKVFDPENTVVLHPKSLNDAIGGGIPRAGHVIVFARPEMGKSAFGINLSASFANQGDRTLYFGNEDPAMLMLLRFISRFTGLTRQQILADQDRATEIALQRGYGNLRFVSKAPGTMADVRKHILEYKPKVVVVDQLTNLACGDKSKTDKFEELAYRMRMLLKETNTAGVSLCQAGESAEGKLILEMDDVYYSNTGVAAQADVMIGIGANGDFINLGRRMLSLPKNKLSGSHEAVPVALDPFRSKLSDV